MHPINRPFDAGFPWWMVYGPSFLLLWVAVGWAIKAFFFSRLRRIAAKTESRLDDLLIGALNLPVMLMLAATSVVAMVEWTPWQRDLNSPPGYYYLLRLTNVLAGASFLKSATVLAAVIFVDRVVRGAIVFYADRVEFLRTAGGLLQGLTRGVVIALGLLVLLESLGVSITPILASLGIGSLAVAFALQPTLENFFSGVQLVVDRPIQPGHFIRLESGEEGVVEKIGWRSTWVRTPLDNMLIIPNKHLVSARVMNYNYPEKDLAVPVDVGVHYGSDLARVERVALEVARYIQQSAPGAVRAFSPALRFRAFAGSSVDLTVTLRAEEVTAAAALKHEFIKALHARFAKEGIVIPYPITALNLEQEGAGAALGKGSARG